MLSIHIFPLSCRFLTSLFVSNARPSYSEDLTLNLGRVMLRFSVTYTEIIAVCFLRRFLSFVRYTAL